MQSLSQKLPIPNRLWLKPPMMWPNNPGGMSGRGSVQEASDCCALPVAVPTRILAAVRSTLATGAPVLKYQPLAPESTMAVSIRALSITALVLATRQVAQRRSHLAFHLVSEDAAMWTTGGRGSTNAATRMLGAERGGLQIRRFVSVAQTLLMLLLVPVLCRHKAVSQ